jgi:hypothetical protein
MPSLAIYQSENLKRVDSFGDVEIDWRLKLHWVTRKHGVCKTDLSDSG